MTDPELRRLYLDPYRACVRLVSRLESYGDLVPSRKIEAAIGDDIAREALHVERVLRDFSERARNVREMLEDPGRWGMRG